MKKLFSKLKQLIEKPWWSFAGFALACFMLFGFTGSDLWRLLVNFEWVIDAVKWSLIGGAFIFGVSAHTRSNRLFTQLQADFSSLRGEIKSSSFSSQGKLVLPDWLTGDDVMRYYNLSHDLLMQYVRNGLNVYPAGNDVLIHGDEVPPLSEESLGFEIENEDYSLYRFKKPDIEKYIKKENT